MRLKACCLVLQDFCHIFLKINWLFREIYGKSFECICEYSIEFYDSDSADIPYSVCLTAFLQDKVNSRLQTLALTNSVG